MSKRKVYLFLSLSIIFLFILVFVYRNSNRSLYPETLIFKDPNALCNTGEGWGGESGDYTSEGIKVDLKVNQFFFVAEFNEVKPIDSTIGQFNKLGFKFAGEMLFADRNEMALIFKNTRINEIDLSKDLKILYYSLPTLKWISPLYQGKEGHTFLVDNTFFVGFGDWVRDDEVEELNKQYNVEIIKYYTLSNSFWLKNKSPWKISTLDLANIYRKKGIVRYSHPNMFSCSALFQNKHEKDCWGICEL